jgi:hypothetical protein
MHRVVPLVALLLLCGVLLLRGAPVGGERGVRGEIEPYGIRHYQPLAFKGGEKALVIVSGNGQTYMGLYVYDQQGNCVAWDDLGNKHTKDDLAVEWYPAQTAPHTIEIHNFGPRRNIYQMAVR